MHIFTYIAVYRIHIALCAVGLAEDKHLVVDYAVILDETLRIDMIDIIELSSKRLQLYRLIRIHTSAKLHIVEEKLFALQLCVSRFAHRFELLLKQTHILAAALFIELENLLFSRCSPLAFFLAGGVSRRLDKYFFRLSERFYNIFDYVKRSVYRSAHRIGNIHIVKTAVQGLRMLRIVVVPDCFELVLKGEPVGVRHNFHEIILRLPKGGDNRHHFAGLFSDALHAGEESARKSAEIMYSQRTDIFAVGIVHVGIFALQPCGKPRFILGV